MYRSRISKTAVALSKVGGQVMVALVMAVVLAVSASAQQQCSDSQFVERVFGDFLFRAPDSAAVSFYTPLVASVGRQAVAASITGSQEYAADLVGGNPTVVAGLYQKYLGHNPNSGDVTFWVGKEPMKDSAIIATLMGSTDYQIRATGLNPAISAANSKIVNQMFLDLLGRSATNSELTFYGGQLTQGRPTVATNIMATDEYFKRMIQQAFQRMLHRPPADADMTFYLAAVKTAPRPDEDLLNALAGSAEYCNGTAQSPTFGFVAPSDVLPALNSPVIPSNVDQLPAVQLGPVDVASNTAVLILGAEAASAANTISSLQNEVTTLQQQVSTDANTINSLQSQLTAAQAQAAADANTIRSLQTQVTSLQQQLTDANNALAPLQAQVTSLQQQLATANNTINSLQGQVNTLQQQLAAANSTIAALQGQVGTLQQQTTADAATIASLQAQVSSLTFQLSSVDSTIAAQQRTILDIASVLVGQAPNQAAALAAGSVAQAKVSQSTGNPALVQQAQSALAKGNAEVKNGDYAGAVKDFKLAYLLATNAAK